MIIVNINIAIGHSFPVLQSEIISFQRLDCLQQFLGINEPITARW
jgi:hypothetical protein